MSDFSSSNKEQLTFNGIRTLWMVLQSTELKQESFIKAKYDELATDYFSARGFFELLGFVETKDGQIEPINALKNLLVSDPSSNLEEFKTLLRSELLAGNNSSSTIDEFLSLFRRVDKDMILQLTIDERLKYSDLRNLFVELGILEYVPTIDAYRVEDVLREQVKRAINKIRLGGLTAEQFAEILLNQEKLGKEAELRIIEFEKNRLKSNRFLVDKIEHTARVNVTAGYDICSWEIPSVEYTEDRERYIEVKAVSDKDFKFVWTINEIEQAVQLKDKYYLYLLPVGRSGTFKINDLKIISNPYENVFQNKKGWSKAEKAYTIWRVGKIV